MGLYVGLRDPALMIWVTEDTRSSTTHHHRDTTTVDLYSKVLKIVRMMVLC